MIQHVYERAARAHVERVIVATDDERIARVVKAFGGEVRMTSAEHRSGTDRIAEAAADVAADIVVNVQGDEPLIPPKLIRQVARILSNRRCLLAEIAHGNPRGPVNSVLAT